MTDLQTSLIAIGGVIVVGVISYNKWQERKARKSVERAFSSEHDDVLMTSAAARAPDIDERHDPMLDAYPEPATTAAMASAASAVSSEGVLPEVGEQFDDGAAVNLGRKAYQKELPIDELVDCLIPLALLNPVRAEKIIPALQTLRHVGNKPIHFIGQREDGSWEEVSYGSAYSSLMAGVQLANRGSALNELEYSELVMRLRQVADGLDAEPQVPDMTNVMISARALHQFVSEYDAQLSVNVRSNGAPWAINTLLAALERQGFDLRPDGRLVMPDGDGGTLFSLSTNVTLAEETTSRLTLLLDVPCVALDRDGFGAMIACAKSLATRLDGVIVDDGGQALAEAALGEISGQVAAFYSDMQAADIPAGSTRALRLFS